MGLNILSSSSSSEILAMEESLSLSDNTSTFLLGMGLIGLLSTSDDTGGGSALESACGGSGCKSLSLPLDTWSSFSTSSSNVYFALPAAATTTKKSLQGYEMQV